ncbi:MAG: hypothetical protein ACI902_000981, partial [Psychroserpens sp.]
WHASYKKRPSNNIFLPVQLEAFFRVLFEIKPNNSI